MCATCIAQHPGANGAVMALTARDQTRHCDVGAVAQCIRSIHCKAPAGTLTKAAQVAAGQSAVQRGAEGSRRLYTQGLSVESIDLNTGSYTRNPRSLVAHPEVPALALCRREPEHATEWDNRLKGHHTLARASLDPGPWPHAQSTLARACAPLWRAHSAWRRPRRSSPARTIPECTTSAARRGRCAAMRYRNETRRRAPNPDRDALRTRRRRPPPTPRPRWARATRW